MSTPSTTRKPLARGTVLDDRFKIVDFLGAGAFGEVYQARQLIFGQSFRTVALKLFAEGVVVAGNATEVLNDALIVLGLLEENPSTEVASRLIQVYDMGLVHSPESRAFLSMKLIPGKRDLRSEIRRHSGGMPVILSLRYLREMLVPLAWMHTLETAAVHGDLKPANIMMTEQSRLVLVDFGLAARLPLGARGGTLSYMAPEILLDVRGGSAADVYAVGLIWYELLTGKGPFDDVGIEANAAGDTERYRAEHRDARAWPWAPLNPNVPEHLQEKRIAPVSEINSEVAEQHPRLERLIQSCLEHDLSRRLPNARVLLDEIEAYLRAKPPSAAEWEILDVGRGVTWAGESIRTEPELPARKTEEMLLADAAALAGQGKLESALSLLGTIAEASPRRVDALLLEVKLLVRGGNLARAGDRCVKAQSLAPTRPEVYEALAEIRLAQGKPTQAAGFRAKAVDLRRGAPPSR